MLKDKFIEYVQKVGTNKDTYDMAQDLVGIAEKYYAKEVLDKVKLEADNQSLKEQLDNIKYLDRDKVEHICVLYQCYKVGTRYDFIERIMNLAIPEKKLDRDRVIEVLKSYMMIDCKYGNSWRTGFKHKVMSKIADEILGSK